ncbi:hypothetical protein BD289DRAFT_422903, partial [Coniella lustricola]
TARRRDGETSTLVSCITPSQPPFRFIVSTDCCDRCQAHHPPESRPPSQCDSTVPVQWHRQCRNAAPSPVEPQPPEQHTALHIVYSIQNSQIPPQLEIPPK